MPGVELGDFTIVAAGSVVTKSFVNGYCIISGIPAIEMKKLDETRCVRYESDSEYIGYIKKSNFEFYRKKYLKV
jgi:acetyltransferase-like isoleucine patch superfamily enzyme